VVSLLGGEWAQSQPLIYASIPAGLALLLGAPANSTLIVFGRQRELLVWRLVIVFVGPALVFLSPVVGLESTTSVFLASMSVLVVTALYAVRARGIIEQAADRPRS
jgi:O-antigen/teichoic acid export membrane protein